VSLIPAATAMSQALSQMATVRNEQPAVIGDGVHLSFGEFDDLVTKHTLRLEEGGVTRSDLVALELDRSADALACIYALWRIGAGYVPVDPATPGAYRARLLDEAGVSFSIVRAPDDDRAWALRDASRSETVQLPSPRRTGDVPAYAIFTSGSSGHRRCVVVGHDQVAALADALRATVYADAEPDGLRVAMNGPLAFDTSVKQLIQLSEGHSIVLVPDAVRAAPERMYEYLLRHQVDVIDATPSLARRWLDHDVLQRAGRPVVERLLLGGEAVDGGLWERLSAIDGLDSYNLYGPTECTVDATWAKVQGDVPTLGSALPGVEVTLVGPSGRAVPPFVTGEIVISGWGVAWGYVDDDESGYLEDRCAYRTGDFARRHADGTLEFMGRSDTQVKVNGVRVDLVEIETALRSLPTVRDAAVAVRADGSLVAVVVLSSGGADGSTIRSELASLLPTALLPAEVVPVDAVPLTDRGKIDRQVVAESVVDYGGPATDPLEITVAEAMAALVGGPALERHESFFRRGGDSLGILELSSVLADVIGSEVDVAEIILTPTPAGVAALAGGVRDTSKTRPTQVDAATSKSTVRLAPTIERSLGDAIACGHLPPLDAVSINCVPDVGRAAIGTGDDLRAVTGGLPTLAVLRDTPLGRLGVILIPCFSSEALRLGGQLIEPAVRLGATLGARAASLTGELAPATDYGSQLPARIGGALITSGQGSTVAAMVNCWEAALEEVGREPSQEHVLIIGPGALTAGFADHLARSAVRTASLRQADGSETSHDGPPATSVVIAGLPRSAVDAGLFGEEVVTVEYGTGLAGGAGRKTTGRPRVLAGGTLISPEPMVDLIHVPPGLGHADEGLLQQALRADEDRVAACALAALLVANAEAPRLIGPPDADTVGFYRTSQRRLGYRPDLNGDQ
jgi:amino acid adenylation domain-containing protein